MSEAIECTIRQTATFTLVEFHCPGERLFVPADLGKLVPPKVMADKGVTIPKEGPI